MKKLLLITFILLNIIHVHANETPIFQEIQNKDPLIVAAFELGFLSSIICGCSTNYYLSEFCSCSAEPIYNTLDILEENTSRDEIKNILKTTAELFNRVWGRKYIAYLKDEDARRAKEIIHDENCDRDCKTRNYYNKYDNTETDRLFPIIETRVEGEIQGLILLEKGNFTEIRENFKYCLNHLSLYLHNELQTTKWSN